jgi:carbonic anhydrase
LNSIEDENKKFDRLVELNVQEQVLHLAKTSIIQRAWKREQSPLIHGWVYGLNDGIIKPVCELNPDSEIEDLYKYDDI